MPSIRKVKTASGAAAIQVVAYKNRKVAVLKHIGSARTEEEAGALFAEAETWIAEESSQSPLFPRTKKRSLSLDTAKYVGVHHAFARETLLSVASAIGFCSLPALLVDLSIMRLIEPVSKLRTIELLARYFGVRYAERTVYRTLPKLKAHKEEAERIAVSFAKDRLSGDLSVVLYDVTTLYFETFDRDELRVPGFSKDNKSNQPQIVVGLLVTRDGFPLGYEVFKGNTFEGHTMIPVLESFAKAHGVSTPTVVADAAMISRANVAELEARGLSYIVGARLGSVSLDIAAKASADLARKDGATVRIKTGHGDLVVSFSAKRYRKDKAEMEKQIAKAETLIARGEPGRRAKFVGRKNEKGAYVLDGALTKKTEILLGMKGYHTNISADILPDASVIERYHDLWNVEKAFRIAKSDLAARPMFHRKEDAVRAHMAVCFVALVMGKTIEMRSGMSLRKAIDLLWSVTDATIADTATGEKFVLRSEMSGGVENFLKKVGRSY